MKRVKDRYIPGGHHRELFSILFKMNLIENARMFASNLHNGQFRADGKTPYIKHLKAVVNLLKEIGITDENIICAAWLHDVMEDCNIPKSKIKSKFNSEIARIVFNLTRNVDREAYKKRIKNADYAVKIIKLADVIHNVSELNKGATKKMIERKLKDCDSFYLPLAKSVSLTFYRKLKKNVEKINKSYAKLV